MADLQARFRARFVEVARDRLSRAEEHLASDDPYWWDRIRTELHTLGGEASMLGFSAVVAATRAAEAATRVGHEGAAEGAMAAQRTLLREALVNVRASIDVLAQS